MLLSSILITSSEGDGDRTLPPIVEDNVESLKRKHSELEHRLFLQDDVIELLQAKFPGHVLEAYLALKPYAYRADLARYCILHEFGGLYADLSYFFVGQVPMPEDQLVVFRGNLMSSPWDTSNAIIYAPAKHKAFERAIELVCANVKRRYYGLTALCPTGPALFGKALAMTCEAEELLTGTASLLKAEPVEQIVPNLRFPKNALVHCQFLKRTMIAVKRKGVLSSGLIELGVTTGNAYRELWDNRQVYS